MTGKSERKSDEERAFCLKMDLLKDYEFRVRFDKEHFDDLLMDEPLPLGGEAAPNASRVLAAAIGNCLSASLLFCVRKSRAEVRALHTEVRVQHTRNERGRLRIGKVEVEITPEFGETDAARIERCKGLFEDFCVVTQSVREGIDVSVSVKS